MAPEALPSATALQATLAQAVKHEAGSAELAARAALARNLPPHNPAAKTPFDAYPLATLLPPGVSWEAVPWRALLAAAEGPGRAALEGGPSEECPPELAPVARSPYCLARLEALAGTVGPAQQRKAQALALLALLLQLDAAPHTLAAATFEELNLPDTALRAAFLAAFAEPAGAPGQPPSRWVRPQRLRDLLRSYVLVTALIADDFNLELAGLGVELKCGLESLAKAVNNIGGRTLRAPGQKARVTLLATGAHATLGAALPDTTTRVRQKAK